MVLAGLRSGLIAISAAALLATPLAATAQDSGEWRNGLAIMAEPKLPKDFPHFPYVNPTAPKGGELKLSAEGTFDSLNPVLTLRGSPALGISQVFDTLMKPSEDEISTAYGLLAEGVSYPADISSATFRLRSEAKWADGQPVTPEDVVFSFEKLKELNPQLAGYYNHVTGAEKTGDRDVTFRFAEKDNQELPSIVGQFPIVAKHWWEGQAANGQQRDISRTTLEPVMGSGPYRVTTVSAGSAVRYELRDDYWGKDLNVNVGQNNFRAVTYTYFADGDVEFEAFRAGNIDYYQEASSSRWATRYEFDAVKDGRVKRESLTNPFRATGIMQAMVPNMRREMFKDPKVRQALNYVLDFEDLNKNLAYNGLKRVDSYFWGTELASSGLPQGRELEILQGLKDKIPPEVFTTPFKNPVGGDPQKVRDNLRQAVTLFKQAGWELKGNRLVNTKTGKPMSFEILLSSQSMERSVLPYVASLKRIGIDARLRTVDSSQYINRTRSFDYDMIWVVWAQSMNPGNEQADYWGSASADRQGSRNYAGISDPAVDALIRMVTAATNREELTAVVKAMDRVLLANHYVVPLFYAGAAKIAYWDRIAHPELPAYGVGFPDIWWDKNASQ